MRQRLIMAGMLTADVAILALSPIIAFYLRFDGQESLGVTYYSDLVRFLPVIVIVQLISLYAFWVYKRLWRYAGVSELLAIVKAIALGIAALHGLAFTFGISMPRSLYLLCLLLNVAMISATRLAVRFFYNRGQLFSRDAVRVLVVGAGTAGAAIIREIRIYYRDNKKVVGLIDDDPKKLGQILNGVKVIGDRNDIQRIVTEKKVREIIIAVPSVRSSLVRGIVETCKKTKCDVKIVPAFREVIDGQVTMRQLRDINLEDLLGRDPVKLDPALMKACLSNKRVLVTGAGGSIGSELCRQIAKMSPARLFLVGKSENNIFEIERELRWIHPALEIEAIIADICVEKRVRKIFEETRPEIVFHAAAHKHVPLMEAQPDEAVRNNIFGTRTVAEAALAVGAERFVMVSTDKAINPTSVMGATKRVAEMIICSMQDKGVTKFAAVRFGNVLGSRGSVVPYFRKMIAEGKALTVTHPEMRRYFMTIPEAAQLVLQAGAMAEGGEVFVLDMGEQVKIVDLACHLIELVGLTPYKDINIEFTGLRPGEKMYEELLSAEEGSTATKHEKVFIANLKKVDEKKLYQAISLLKHADDPDKIRVVLGKLIPTYQSPRLKLSVVDGDNSRSTITGS